MKFGDFFIGMPVYIDHEKNDPEYFEYGVITKYSYNHNGIHYVNVDLGEYELEFDLHQLKSAKGNV